MISREEINSPLTFDAEGRVVVDTAGAVVVGPDGKLAVLVGNGLSIRTGSPQFVGARTSRTIVVDRAGDLQANVSPDDIRGLAAYVRKLVLTTAQDVSYAEPLVASSGTEPPIL